MQLFVRTKKKQKIRTERTLCSKVILFFQVCVTTIDFAPENELGQYSAD